MMIDGNKVRIMTVSIHRRILIVVVVIGRRRSISGSVSPFSWGGLLSLSLGLLSRSSKLRLNTVKNGNSSNTQKGGSHLGEDPAADGGSLMLLGLRLLGSGSSLRRGFRRRGGWTELVGFNKLAEPFEFLGMFQGHRVGLTSLLLKLLGELFA